MEQQANNFGFGIFGDLISSQPLDDFRWVVTIEAFGDWDGKRFEFSIIFDTSRHDDFIIDNDDTPIKIM